MSPVGPVTATVSLREARVVLVEPAGRGVTSGVYVAWSGRRKRSVVVAGLAREHDARRLPGAQDPWLDGPHRLATGMRQQLVHRRES
jgi:hypothetical protein